MKTAYSPLRIEILIHYNITENLVQNAEAPRVIKETQDLIIEEALQHGNEYGYQLTPLGKAWVQRYRDRSPLMSKGGFCETQQC